jgi:hypothetical protein
VVIASIAISDGTVRFAVAVPPSLVPTAAIPFDLRADGSLLFAERRGAGTAIRLMAAGDGNPSILREVLLSTGKTPLTAPVADVVRAGSDGSVLLLTGAPGAAAVYRARLGASTAAERLRFPTEAAGLTARLAALPVEGAALTGTGPASLLFARLAGSAFESPLIVAAPGVAP